MLIAALLTHYCSSLILLFSSFLSSLPGKSSQNLFTSLSFLSDSWHHTSLLDHQFSLELHVTRIGLSAPFVSFLLADYEDVQRRVRFISRRLGIRDRERTVFLHSLFESSGKKERFLQIFVWICFCRKIRRNYDTDCHLPLHPEVCHRGSIYLTTAVATAYLEVFCVFCNVRLVC